MNFLKIAAIAGVVAVGAPVAASAATIVGEINIGGLADTRDLTDATAGDVVSGGQAADNAGIDVTFGLASYQSGTGDFSGGTFGDIVAMTNIDFSAAPQVVWTFDGFEFYGETYKDFSQGTNEKSFTIVGYVAKAGFEDTIALLDFTTQNRVGSISFSTTTTAVPLPAGILLMGTALAGFGVMRRRKKAA